LKAGINGASPARWLANHWPSTFNIWLRKISTLQSAAMNSAQNTADCLEDYCQNDKCAWS